MLQRSALSCVNSKANLKITGPSLCAFKSIYNFFFLKQMYNIITIYFHPYKCACVLFTLLMCRTEEILCNRYTGVELPSLSSETKIILTSPTTRDNNVRSSGKTFRPLSLEYPFTSTKKKYVIILIIIVIFISNIIPA